MDKSEVKQLQRALRDNTGLAVIVDGNFGKQSQLAFDTFRASVGLTDPEALALLKKYANVRYVNDQAFAVAASILGVEQAYVRAIAEVETNGESFLKDGRVKILFERHWFIRKLREAMVNVGVRKNVAIAVGSTVFMEPSSIEPLITLVSKKYENICSATRGGYKGNEAEWDRLNLAMTLDVEAACQSTSFGGYQLMGFNHKLCGYPTAKDMMLAMALSESKQFLGMISFIKSNPHIHKALKAGNWAKFAEGYNGAAYKENKYDIKLAAAASKWLDEAGETRLA